MSQLCKACLGVAAVLALAALPAAGQTDEIGIYYDPGATVGEGFVPPWVAFDLFFCLTNPSSVVVIGFEFGYTVEEWGAGGQLSRLATTLPPTAIDSGDSADLTAGDYVVSLSAPLLGNQVMVLVHWQMVMESAIAAGLTVGPAHNPSLPLGVPLYNDGSKMVPMPAASTCWGQEFRLNHYCPLAAEARTMGAVKALYR